MSGISGTELVITIIEKSGKQLEFPTAQTEYDCSPEYWCGYSQRELAEKSGVNLRTLQQYELKTKDINKASVQSIVALANVLGCKVEDLMEYSTGNTLCNGCL